MKVKIKLALLAVLGFFSFVLPAQESNIKTIQMDVFPMSEFASNFGYRLLAKGYDSAKKSWGMGYSRSSLNGKSSIYYRSQGGKFLSATKELVPFQTNKITVTFDNGKAVMYLNGEKIAEGSGVLPPHENSYRLVVGAYASGAFKFPGKVTNVKFLNKVVVPEKFTPQEKFTKHFSFVSTETRKPLPFKVVRGNWKRMPWGYAELSDNVETNALAVLDQVMPESFVYTARITTFDNVGNIILEFCRQDDKNCYRVVHQGASAVKTIFIYKVENGVETLLNKVTSDTIKIPTAGTRLAPLTISIGRHENMIHVRVNDTEMVSAYDETFKKGTIGFGVHERKAKFRQITVTSYSAYAVNSKPKPLAKQELILNAPTQRTVFYRDEEIVLNAEFINRSGTPADPGKVQFVFNKKAQTWNPGKVAASSSANRQFVIDGSKLSDGDYTVTLSSGKMNASFKITLLTRPQKDLYTFYSWANGDLAAMNQNHFNGVTFVVFLTDEIKYLRQTIAAKNDYAMKHNMKLGVHIPMLSRTPAGGKAMTVIRKDGKYSGKLNARNEAAQKFIKDRVAKVMEMLKDYPAINRILLDSEVENFLELSYGKKDIDLARKELGFEPPMSETADMELDGTRGRVVSLPKSIKAKTPAVFPLSDKNYRFMLWYWERGTGDNLIRAEAAKIIKKYRPDILIHHDPYRDVPLSSRMLGMDAPGTWFYCHPDAGETFMAVESQLSSCRAGGRPEKFILDPSLWLYSMRIGPARNLWAGVQPANIYLTALHLGFAAKPEAIEIYDLNFLLPTSTPQFREKHIRAEVSNFAKNIVKPLWSATRHLDREQPRTALMLSFSTQIFNRSYWGGYGNSQANAILNLFWKANIPTAIITEEAVRNGELAKYDRILLYRTSHLPQDVFDAIKKFAAKGGKVLTEPDSPWSKLIPGAISYPIETDKLTKTTYYQIMRKDGFTADVVYAEQQKYAKDLRKFRPDGLTFADSNSTELYIRTLQSGDCKYVFLMNDKRTFGDYFGKKYKAVFDAGLPLTAEVSLKTNGAVYEFPARKKHTLKNGKLTLDFKPTEGKILVIYPEAVAAVKVENTPSFSAGKPALFEISVLNSKQNKLKGIQPIRVVLTKPNGKKIEQFISAVNGTAEYTYLPGDKELKGKWKLEVTEMASGISISKEWVH